MSPRFVAHRLDDVLGGLVDRHRDVAARRDPYPGARAVITERGCDGAADAILFTASRQLDHLIEVAAQMGREAALRAALSERVLVVSIGPMTSEALAEQGLRADLEPVHPKMGHMVKTLAEDGVRALERKRAAANG